MYIVGFRYYCLPRRAAIFPSLVYANGSQPVVRVPLGVVRETFLGGKQWWILGEANEAVSSGPPSKIPHCIKFF